MGHGGPGGVRGRGPGCVGEGAQAPAQREGEPPEVPSRRKLDPLAPRQAHPGCRAESGLEGGERRSRSQAWNRRGSSGR